MGFLDSVSSNFSANISSAAGKSASPTGSDELIPKIPSQKGDTYGSSSLEVSDKNFLKVNAENWYKVYPYQLKVVKVDKNSKEAVKPPIKSYVYTFPIPPESISVQMMMASTVTPTLGGMVEETSKNVLWSVQISGTTGIAPSQKGSSGSDFLNVLNNVSNAFTGGSSDADGNQISKDDYTQAAKTFRNVIGTTGLLAGIGNGLQKGIGTLSGIAGGVETSISAFKGGSASSLLGGVATGVESALLPHLPYSVSAVDQVSNGYSTIAELHRFLYAYSTNKEDDPDSYQLHFINYKDVQDFQCVIKSIAFQKSASEPYLYRYRISLLGWNPSAPDENGGLPIDRFGPNGDLKTVNTLTISGMASAAGGLKANITRAFGK